MTFTTDSIVLIGSIVVFAAILAGRAGARLGMPSLLLFLAVGMLCGQDGLGIQFDNSGIAQFIGMLALCVILFSGGLDTRYSDIKPIWKPGAMLATAGVVVSALLTAVFIYGISQIFSLQLSFLEALLMASVMSSTDSASVFSILRGKRQTLKQNLRPLLELESGSNDPMAYIMTLIVLSMTLGGENNHLGWQYVLMTLTLEICVGTIAGILFGRGIVWVMNRANIKDTSLASILLLAAVFVTFSVTDTIHGNGYLAVYIAGLVTGNGTMVAKKALSKSMNGYTWLFQIAMFLTLGLLVNPSSLVEPRTAALGLGVGLFMMLVARPVAVMLCLLPFRNFSFKARLFMSWVGLRGAVPIIFATYPLVEIHRGFNPTTAYMIFNVVFFITILSLALQGSTVSALARRFGLLEPEPEDRFGIDLPDKIQAALSEVEVNDDFLAAGDTLKDTAVPDNTLVLLVKRGEHYFVPRGATKLRKGDILLTIAEDKTTD